MIGDYNRIIDSMYNYKHEMSVEPYVGAGSYRHDNKVGEFNRNNRAIYASANSTGGVHGYSEAQEDWNGTTTAQRFIDRTNDEVRNFNWEFGNEDNDEFKALFGNLVKGTDGRYYIEEPNGSVVPVTEPGTQTNPANTQGQPVRGSETQGVGTEQKGEETPQNVKEGVDWRYGLPGYLSATRFLHSRLHNLNQLKNAKKIPLLQYDPSEAYLWQRGNLGAIQRGHQAAGQINHLADTPVTPDAAQYMAGRLQAYNTGLQHVAQGYQTNDTAVEKSTEANWNQERKNQESRYNTGIKNKENEFEHRVNWLTALGNYKRANYESLNNLLTGMESNAKNWVSENKAYGESVQKASLQNMISSDLKKYFNDITADDEALMNDYLSGDLRFSDMTEDEQNTVSKWNNKIQEEVLRQMAAMRGFSYIPYQRQSGAYTGFTPDYIGFQKKGGTLGNDAKVEIQKLRAKVQKMQVFQKHLEARMNAFEKDLDRAQKGAGQYIQGQKWTK